MFYLNGINFVLRGGDEHRKLKLSQFTFRDTHDPDNPGELIRCVEYTEHGSKNRHGGRLQLNQDNKVVMQFARPETGVMYFYLSYISRNFLIVHCKPIHST